MVLASRITAQRPLSLLGGRRGSHDPNSPQLNMGRRSHLSRPARDPLGRRSGPRDETARRPPTIRESFFRYGTSPEEEDRDDTTLDSLPDPSRARGGEPASDRGGVPRPLRIAPRRDPVRRPAARRNDV